MEIDTRITDIYIHAYIYIFENHRHLPISILLFNSKGERVFEEVFLNILSLSFFSNLFIRRIFFPLFGGRRREGKKLRSSKNPPFEVSANAMYLIPFIPRANTRAGKGLEGLGRGRISPIMDGRRVFRQREDLFLVDLQCFMVSVSLLQQIIAN